MTFLPDSINFAVFSQNFPTIWTETGTLESYRIFFEICLLSKAGHWHAVKAREKLSRGSHHKSLLNIANYTEALESNQYLPNQTKKDQSFLHPKYPQMYGYPSTYDILEFNFFVQE